jgi:hypothetical protein
MGGLRGSRLMALAPFRAPATPLVTLDHVMRLVRMPADL